MCAFAKAFLVKISRIKVDVTGKRLVVSGVVCFFSYGPTSVEGKRMHNCVTGLANETLLDREPYVYIT